VWPRRCGKVYDTPLTSGIVSLWTRPDIKSVPSAGLTTREDWSIALLPFFNLRKKNSPRLRYDSKLSSTSPKFTPKAAEYVLYNGDLIERGRYISFTKPQARESVRQGRIEYSRTCHGDDGSFDDDRL